MEQHQTAVQFDKQALRAAADALFAAGYTVTGSEFKAPKLRPWKKSTREELYTCTQHDILSGRANSLTVRMDGELAAVDLDFHNEQHTGIFLRLWSERIGQAFTVRGKKGCKLFCRLQDKQGPEATAILLPKCYPASTDWSDDSQKEQSAEVELKRDVSTVYGLHSPGLAYGYIAGTQPFIGAALEDLPLVSMTMLQALCAGLQEEASLVPWGGLYVEGAEKLRARWCIGVLTGDTEIMRAYYRENGADVHTVQDLTSFLNIFGHVFELETVQAYLHGGQADGPRADSLRHVMESVQKVQKTAPMAENAAQCRKLLSAAYSADLGRLKLALAAELKPSEWEQMKTGLEMADFLQLWDTAQKFLPEDRLRALSIQALRRSA